MVSLREMARADAERVPPVWLLPLLEAMFFVPCPEHPEASRATRSGGCNMFCTVCTGRARCHACIAADHAGHHVIQVGVQVRRSSNHNAVKVKDVEALLNVDGVQPYLINSENAVFLNPRPQSGNGRHGEHRCKDKDCDRALLDDAYHFCSLRCKPSRAVHQRFAEKVDTGEHPEASRSTRSGGCNFFCTVCTGRSLCHACIAGDHAGHHVIQVRKSSGHNVVKVKDVEALLNVDGVQPYLINSENAVFLNPRPQAGDGMAGEHRCKDCSRALRDKAYHFCSLRCKLECMEGDINISFAVQPASESESSEDETETDDDALFHPTKRLRKSASRSEGLGTGNRVEEDGAGTSAAPGHQ
ncbi:hypothetical protein PR202_ga06698 [Eleusine coracana subsp. coracana]|uniref:PLATZ transcription factor family protein n=1 Tax=Eleusine coracana subsp. coracana TaxID=191504 RepID=A0AAV5BVS1_ELECO|nr:hypothetical protein PR202_ga06698 [Eleusine coracana subsp. coracana]